MINRGLFTGLDIVDLKIFNTNLSTLDENSFSALSGELDILSLTASRIHEIPIKAIAHLGNTTVLDLSENRITALPERAFEGMHSLQELALAKNSISSIDANAFRGLG